MAKALTALFVPVVVFEICIVLCAMIVGELQYGLELIFHGNAFVHIAASQKVETERVKVAFVQ